MFFCENDGNMLYIKIDDKEKLKYTCKLCNSEYDVEELNKDKTRNCIYKHNYDTNNYSFKTYVNDNIFNDPTLPRLGNLKCINDECKTNTEGMAKEVVYIKYSKEDMLYLYCCARCKTRRTSANTTVQ